MGQSETSRKRPGPRSETLREGIGYLPTYFRGGRGENPDSATLLFRRFALTRGPSGKLHGHVKSDGITFATADEMVDWIVENDAFELPDEADGNPRYLPPAFDPQVVRDV